MDFHIRDDFVDQETHPKSKKEWGEIFQDEPNDGHHSKKRSEPETLDKGDPRGKHHADEQEDARRKDHDKIDSHSTKDSMAFLDPKDNIQGCPQ